MRSMSSEQFPLARGNDKDSSPSEQWKTKVLKTLRDVKYGPANEVLQALCQQAIKERDVPREYILDVLLTVIHSYVPKTLSGQELDEVESARGRLLADKQRVEKASEFLAKAEKLVTEALCSCGDPYLDSQLSEKLDNIFECSHETTHILDEWMHCAARRLDQRSKGRDEGVVVELCMALRKVTGKESYGEVELLIDAAYESEGLQPETGSVIDDETGEKRLPRQGTGPGRYSDGLSVRIQPYFYISQRSTTTPCLRKGTAGSRKYLDVIPQRFS